MTKSTDKNQPPLPVEITSIPDKETAQWAIKYLAQFEGEAVWTMILQQFTPSMHEKLVLTAKSIRTIKET